MDGSTDRGNVEDELIVILYSIKDTVAEEIVLDFSLCKSPKRLMPMDLSNVLVGF